MKTRKRKPGAGRPDEGRQKLTCYPLPKTVTALRAGRDKTHNTLGKVLDQWKDKI